MASYLMRVIRETTREMTNSGQPMFAEEVDAPRLRSYVEVAQANMPLYDGVTYEECELGGIEAELSMPDHAREDAIIIYMHGGGLVCGNARTSRGYASMVAGESRIPVYSTSYRLAPENPYPACVDDCFAAYLAVMEKHPDVPIFLIGESGGAYLSLTTALKARDAGVRIPAAIVLSSPIIDFSGTIDHSHYGWNEITIVEAGIRALAKCYCPDESLRKEPLCSPRFADFTGISPTYVAWDDGETLAADAEILVRKLKAARVPLKWKRFSGCFHAFAPVGRNTPESSELLDDNIAFMLEHLHDQRLAYDDEEEE